MHMVCLHNGRQRWGEAMNARPRTLTPRVVLQVLLFVVIVPFLPLLISQDWGWWEAWVYALVSILGFVISRALAARRHPDLLAERARMLRHDDAEPWDRTLAPLVGLGGALIPLVAGIDALVPGLPAFPLPLKMLSLALIVSGYVLGSCALIANRFFSGMVRIQARPWTRSRHPRPVPLPSPSRLCRRADDLSCDPLLSGFALGDNPGLLAVHRLRLSALGLKTKPCRTNSKGIVRMQARYAIASCPECGDWRR